MEWEAESVWRFRQRDRGMKRRPRGALAEPDSYHVELERAADLYLTSLVNYDEVIVYKGRRLRSLVMTDKQTRWSAPLTLARNNDADSAGKLAGMTIANSVFIGSLPNNSFVAWAAVVAAFKTGRQ